MYARNYNSSPACGEARAPRAWHRPTPHSRVRRVVEASERRHMRLVLSIHVALSFSCDRQDYQPGQWKSDDAVAMYSSLLPLSAPRTPNMFWHQLLPWLLNRLQEKPLEVGRGAQLLSRLFRQISWEGIAAIPRTVPLLAEPAASTGDEPNTAIAIWICAFMTLSNCGH